MAGVTQPETPEINLNLVQISELACKLFSNAFIRQAKAKAKPLMKDLKNGKSIPVGSLTVSRKTGSGDDEQTQNIDIPVRMALDYSEYRGPFSFPAFQEAVRSMIERLARALQDKKDLNILTNKQTGAALVHQPGVIKVGDKYNVLVFVVEPGGSKSIVLKLMFLDPNQYEQLRDQATDVEAVTK